MLTALGPPTNISKTSNITNYDNDNYNHNSSKYDISYNNNDKRDVDVSNNEELGTTVGKRISRLCWDDSVQLIFEQIETISGKKRLIKQMKCTNTCKTRRIYKQKNKGGFLATHASGIINCILIPLVCYMNVLNCVTAKVRNTICTFMLGASARSTDDDSFGIEIWPYLQHEFEK
ncbi:hypothetical protein HELRODRAFT_160428 [Helobdella robusta]|uniref:Uncharacterized protein n=1 Tax=Helobdella robusta TaxID=6412 RepID=T1EQ84_HELRO|nr:hypothetical protein HELRODRAFT_160428 [Helobdella robusta]ESO06268.1 hypothetical protein HELRODRAFT_160428 [Helobdella robusta]